MGNMVRAIREKGTFFHQDSKLVFHRRSCSKPQCINNDQTGTRNATKVCLNYTVALCVWIKTFCQLTTRMKHRLRQHYQTINSLTDLFNNLTRTEHHNNKEVTSRIQLTSSHSTQINNSINYRASSSSVNKDSHMWWVTAIRIWEQMLTRASCCRWDHQHRFK